MSTIAVARKDFLDARRAKMVWFVGGIYTLFMVLLFYFGQRDAANPTVESQLGAMMGIGALVIPLIALVAAYLAIAGERESGSIKYLLSIPNNRRDVVFGKFLSRAAIVTAAILLAFVLGVVMALVWYPSLEAELFVKVAALTVLYALTYVAVAIGISAATGSRSRAMAGAIGFFFATNVLTLLPVFEDAISYVLTDLLGAEVTREGIAFTQAVLSPTIAYTYSMALAFPDFGTPGDAWFLEGEVMLAIMAAWVVLPVLVGLWWFQRVDLG